MIARHQARQARHLSEDIDRLTRGEAPHETADPEHRALLDAAARLDRAARGRRAARPGYQAALEARLLARLPLTRRRWWHRFAAPAHPAFSRALMGVAVLALVVAVAGTAATASSRIRVYRPEGPKGGAPIGAPLLPPECAVPYRPADPATTARESGRALAYLPEPPTEVSDTVEVGVLPAGPALPAATRAMHIHAIVRYQGGGHTVLVALDEPSAGLAAQGALDLGERTIRLADGREAWASTHPNLRQGNMVAWVAEGYIVIVASDLPAETVATLAGRVVVAPTVAGAAGDTSPSAPPVSEACRTTAPGGPADLAVSGEVRQGGRGNRPELTYDVQLGNRGDGTAEDVRVAIEPPTALAAHVVDPAAPRTFGRQGPGQLSGLGGTITFDVAGLDPAVVRAALVEGVTVRVTWTEGGEAREGAFVVR